MRNIMKFIHYARLGTFCTPALLPHMVLYVTCMFVYQLLVCDLNDKGLVGMNSG